ncbi:MAG: 23S rRNA (uracil(1939)-C(5))-methyltransferase RlmD [Clostridiales bacterium]|nr:23S rRNA (uracil(1939)-C(5))-methyltransferase RlmD [Clostridiales bacterium]
MAKKRIENAENEIKDLIFPNKGIGEYNGIKAEIANTLPGQKIRYSLYKKKGKYQSNNFEVTEKADYEIEPDCPSFGSCGGCIYRNIPYEKELEIKKNNVLRLLKNAEIDGFEFGGICPSPDIEGYRNKMEFSFGDTGREGDLALGMRKRNSYYEVASAADCKIVCDDIRKILTSVLDFFKKTDEAFYHKMKKTGSLRHLLVRKARFTGEILVALVTTSALKNNLDPLKEILLSLDLEGEIVGFLHITNNSIADAVKADKITTLYGRDFFYEKLLGLTFKISVFSFFQTNSAGAEVLYTTAKEMAETANPKVIFDLYCGTGTIAQLMSENAKEVTGIEIVEEAVEAAKTNAALNNITNCSFIAADVLKGVDSLISSPDLIILDPPREGINPKALTKICRNFQAPTLVYISCKPTSLAHDLPVLKTYGYIPRKITCVDLFPRTPHVETVVLLSQQKHDDCVGAEQ